MTTETVQQKWDSYVRAVMPADAPEIQLVECRRAFMAGAWAMLQASKQVGEDSVSEEAGVAILEGYEQEMRDFYVGVAMGRN